MSPEGTIGTGELILTVSGALKSNISVQTYLTIKKTTQIAEITMMKEVARLQLLG